MAKYLNDDQQNQLMGMLNGQTPPEASPEGTQPPVEDIQGAAPVDSGAAAPEAQPDPNAAILAELGVSSIEELVERYKEREGKANEYKDMLAQLLAYQQALDNEATLEPTDPLNSVKQAVREEIKPLYEKVEADARNKIVQEAWGKDAKEMPDIADVMPEITQFIAEHPELAVANDGLRRAYDSVRSAKYKTEAQMLADDEFVKRMASNEKVRDAVLKSHLAEIARNGENIPNSIGSGGEIPMSGQKQAPNSMQQAKKGLAQMLGLK
jgi:hypothetical protein